MSTGSSIAALYISEAGRFLAERLVGIYPGIIVAKFSKAKTEKLWNECHTLVFVMASGIVLRTIAPLLKDKKSDPAVIVVGETGVHAISLLSGHLGGANERTLEIAAFLGGEAVITTASDLNGLTPVDLWARDNDLVIEDWDALPRLCTQLVNRGKLNVYAECDIPLPGDFHRVPDPSSADMIISNREDFSSAKSFLLRPRNLVAGIGCNRGTEAAEIEGAVRNALRTGSLSFTSLKGVATINLKAEEPGLKTFCEQHNLPMVHFGAEELNGVEGTEKSEAAKKATGAHSVSEAAALLASGAESLLVRKQKLGNVTVAIAESNRKGESVEHKKTGKIYVVGTGPGKADSITPAVVRALRESDVVVGYGTYLDLIPELLEGKEVLSTGMTREIARCRSAVEQALKGKTVAVVSGGDPGIYAMAGLVFEVLSSTVNGTGAAAPQVEVLPGISALNACAARLGAPLMHDFASISLSDRLTPWEVIEKRIAAAALADFVIVLYNPKSKGRPVQIGKARDIILKHRPAATPVGIVKAAMREEEAVVITDLGSMLDAEIDMQTTVIIGNSKTFVWNGRMITPRGYENKAEY